MFVLTLKHGPRSSRKSIDLNKSHNTSSSTEGHAPLDGSNIKFKTSKICTKRKIKFTHTFI